MVGEPSPKHSPLADRHRELGAKSTVFAGWDMPLDYGSVVGEHRAVRAACGVFDLSHLGKLAVTGEHAVDALQHAFTNDVTRLAQGRAHYTLCLNDDGGVVDDLLLYRLEWGYLIICNASNVDAVTRMVIDGPVEPDVTDLTADYACIAVQGPRSMDIALGAGLDVHGMAFLDCAPVRLASPDAAAGEPTGTSALEAGMLARSGYTGERGYEIIVPAERAGSLWDRLLAIEEAVPVGLGARDTLRLEMGYPLHGHELDAQITPVEAGLNFAVALDTGFRGESAVRAAREHRPAQRLVGLRATGRGVPRAGQEVRHGDTPVGRTTSGSFSPTLECGIALGYVDRTVDRGDEVVIDVRGRALSVEVVRPPFVDADPRD